MSHARKTTRIAVPLLLMTLVVAVYGCGTSTTNAYSGTVEDDLFEIQVPMLATPKADLTAWETGSRPQQSSTSNLLAATPTGTRSRVTSAPVEEGDRVEAGEVVAVLDDSLLRAAVQQAKAAARRTRSDVGVIEERLDDVASSKVTIAEKRADVVATISDLERTRSELIAKRADGRSALAQLEQIPLPPPGSTPPTLPPGAPDPSAIRANIAKLRAGIAQLDAALARLESGLAQARKGLDSIDSTRGDLGDASERLEDLNELAEIGADASTVAVDLAEAQLGMATLRSPVDGIVVSSAGPGAVLAPGAPAVTVRADGPRRIRIWLPPELASSVSVGDAAAVRLDSLDATFDGRVSRLGAFAEFPPTSLATSEIHLTRGIEAVITLDTSEHLPPGVPADVLLTR